MERYKVLTIAGSDSGGGAGIQADIKTISALGCYAASAITAVTVQNTLGVQTVHAVPTDIVSGQITAVLDDIGADAIKIGMLFNADIIRAVAKTLLWNKDKGQRTKDNIGDCPIVLDPVMVSTSGHRLMNEDAIETLTTELIPLATLITPNLPEAEVLLGEKITDLTAAAQALAEKYKISVLLKAGHQTQSTIHNPQSTITLRAHQLQLTDILYDYKEARTYTYPHPRVETKNTHGTGCTLSSAIASELAKGLPLNEAIDAAIKYLESALLSAKNDVLGHGFGPVDHFFAQK